MIIDNRMIINNHCNQDELRMGKRKKDYTKLVTWLTIGAITILIWGSILHWVWPWLVS